MPARVVFSVTPQVVDGQLFLYYVLENHSEATLLTDICACGFPIATEIG